MTKKRYNSPFTTNNSLQSAIFSVLILLMIPVYSYAASEKHIMSLDNLRITGNESLKNLRKNIRKSIFTIKSRRSVQELPDLKFYYYKVKPGENFWTVLSRSNLDMDTLISVNSLSGPYDIKPGKKIFIPNMRGIIKKGAQKQKIVSILIKYIIKKEYVLKTNRCKFLNKKYLFIPCAKLSNLEKSLFLGTGFMYPLKKGKRTSGFGTRQNPFNKKMYEFHKGIDLACPIGSKVFSSRGGKVMFAGYKGGYGRLIIIKHEHGYLSFYGHLDKPLVKKGQIVRAGQVIAKSGNTGRSTGPHLHFEIRKNNRAINPGALLHRHRE